MGVKCAIVLDIPYGGGVLVAKVLEAFGYAANEEISNDYQLMSINQIICDKPEDPKISLANAKYAVESIELYVKSKIEEGKDWLMLDPMLCITGCEFINVLKRNNVDYTVFVPMRQPHHCVLDMIKTNKQWNIEKTASLLGRYIVARSMNTERFYVEHKEGKEKIVHITFNDLIDDSEATVKLLASRCGVELNEEVTAKALERLKPSPANKQ